jgi:hypothetical protein
VASAFGRVIAQNMMYNHTISVFTPDGYVSNYSMYGKSFGPEGLDTCSPASAPDSSFLYRIDTTTLKIDRVIPVGGGLPARHRGRAGQQDRLRGGDGR